MFDNIKKIDDPKENVSKFVFKKKDAVVEAVLYRYPTYKNRTVICCSTQSGCPVGCRFCGTGDYFVRSLTADEIVYQSCHLLNEVAILEGTQAKEIEKLQIMFMSMGEPMLNYSSLKEAIKKLYKLFPNARLLISTSAPKAGEKNFDDLNELSKEIETIGLQFSVHESTDEARQKLIPSATLSLQEIANYGANWYNACGRRPFFNYCVHNNNDTNEDVQRLTELFNPNIWEATISVICERDENVAAANERQRQLSSDFMQKMLLAGYSTRMFDPAGQDSIGGGCGQLWFVQDWMKNNPELAKKTKGFGLPKLHTPR